MKKVFTLIILCLCLGSINAQKENEYKFSAGLHYPLSIGDNFVKEEFNGIVGLDLSFKVVPVSFIDLRASLTADYFDYNFSSAYKGYALVLKPKIIGEFNFHSKLKPFISAGYGFMSVSTKVNYAGFDIGSAVVIDGDQRTKNNLNGLNLAFGIKYNFGSALYVQSSFDYFSVNPKDGVPKSSYNKNAHSIYIGAGFNFY